MKATVCLLALVLAASCPSLARADVRIFVEDFSDASGHAAFDPLFNHSCIVDDPDGSWWQVRVSGLLLFTNHVDTVTFNLEPDWSVIGASVECRSYENTARFIGTTGTAEFTANTLPFEPPLFWEVVADEIGEITAIELSASQGIFDNVTIQVRVVPEPSAAVLFATGLFVALVVLARRRLR
jgi:hypothetical protein